MVQYSRDTTIGGRNPSCCFEIKNDNKDIHNKKKALSVFAIERRSLHVVEDEKERDRQESLIDNRKATDNALKRTKLDEENERHEAKINGEIR